MSYDHQLLDTQFHRNIDDALHKRDKNGKNSVMAALTVCKINANVDRCSMLYKYRQKLEQRRAEAANK